MAEGRSLSLALVCRALEQQRNSLTLAADHQSAPGRATHNNSHNNSNNNKHHNQQNQRWNSSSTHSPPTLCEQSSAAAVDVAILVLVLGCCGFLFTPYFQFVAREAAEILPVTLMVVGEVVGQAPVAYAAGAVATFAAVLGAWEIYQYRARRCDSPHCRGLRKAMELDIQLQTEQCVRSGAGGGPLPGLTAAELPWRDRDGAPLPGLAGAGPAAEIGRDQRELEAELRRMAPPNGRAVLIFRAPCGCPTVRFEAWGSKKGRRSKK